uniref:Frizzled-4 n=1 Tax=Globodera pallida TaxID=36090 RepID=A0A183BIC6_GLOPA
MCSDIQYNMTIYPNILKHAKQDEAEIDIKQYEMLVKVQCSVDFKFFLCTLFTPVCTILTDPIPPCRHLCLSAKSGCETLMRKFGYQWPEIFDCEKLPKSRDGMCVGDSKNEDSGGRAVDDEEADQSTERSQHKMLECPHTMKVLSRESHSLFIANQSIEHCSLPCQSDGIVPTFFGVHIRHYLRLWTGAWAVTCCVCCAFTIVTFLIDIKRFEFPEKAIFYMAICYLMVSATYMVGLVEEDSLSCAVSSATKQQLVTQGNENILCFNFCPTLFPIVLPFWVFSSYFNVLAWSLPAIGSVLLVTMGAVDGDMFTGICSLGNLRSEPSLRLALIPQSVAIAVGLMLFTSGFISIMRIRSYIKGHRFVANKFEQADASDKLSKLMFRIGCFSLLYVLPMAVGIFCSFYQAENVAHWITSWYSTRCLHAQRSAFGFTHPRAQCPIGDGVQLSRHPDPLLFFLKYLSNFSTGIACVVWTLNGKTVASYGDFLARLFTSRERRRGRPIRVPTRPN